MKFDKDNNLQNNDQSVNKRIAEMLLSNLLKGKNERDSEMAANDVTNTSSDVINDNDAKSSISVKQKTYAIDKKPSMTSSTSSSSSSNVKDFMKESNILDNELNQLITELHIKHSDDVYNDVREKNPPAAGLRSDSESDAEEDLEGGAINDNDVDNITENNLNDLNSEELLQLGLRLVDQEATTKTNANNLHQHLLEEEQEGRDEDENQELYDDYNHLIKRLQIENEKLKLVRIAMKKITELGAIYAQITPDFQGAYGFELDGEVKINIFLEEIETMKKALQVSKNANTFIKAFSGYKNLHSNDKKIVDEVFKDSNPLFTKVQLFNALRSNGFVVTRTMDQHGFSEPLNDVMKDISKKDLYDDFINDRKSGGRKNVKIVAEQNDLNMNNYSTIVKKISNIVNNLLHQASMLVNNKFSGSNYADNNTLLELYEKIADNMYLVTSYDRKNVQLKKLDTDFDKLYKMVVNGIKTFQPPKASIAGGKIILPDSMFVNQKKYKTNYLHLL